MTGFRDELTRESCNPGQCPAPMEQRLTARRPPVRTAAICVHLCFHYLPGTGTSFPPLAKLETQMNTDDPVRRLCSDTQAGMARSWRRSAGQVTGPGHWYKALMPPDLAGSWPPARHRLFNAIRNGMAWATNQNL